MNLPVTNRKDALSKAVAINIIVTIIVIFLTLNINDFNFGYWFVLPSIIWGVYHYFRNNIKKAIIENEHIRIVLNNKTIRIPILEIKLIESAVSRQNIFTGTFCKTYFIWTKHKYLFGTTLLLGFISKNVFPEEPVEIRTIKSIMAYKEK